MLMNSVVLTVGAILLVLFLIPLILILGFFVVMFILSCISGKYEYEYEQREDGSWSVVPVNLPFGEPIDKEYKRQWHIKRRQYKKWRKSL